MYLSVPLSYSLQKSLFEILTGNYEHYEHTMFFKMKKLMGGLWSNKTKDIYMYCPLILEYYYKFYLSIYEDIIYMISIKGF